MQALWTSHTYTFSDYYMCHTHHSYHRCCRPELPANADSNYAPRESHGTVAGTGKLSNGG
ncbi:hypothetical protein E2C01_052921 [Portunus trituberculatus]|uniref:Uncharacterized protein n=1 Tax=Portunus trituberculatus TaxID=210409 RepID=A0A5B7GF26_PORTR|nr:hypothetical protein [Portunus trituberculatus]